MEMMKKITLITVLVAQAPLVYAAPRAQKNQRQSNKVTTKPTAKSVKMIEDNARACGCQRPQQQPQPQILPAEIAVVQDQLVNETELNKLVKECCTMLMDEAQKLQNECLIEEIAEMISIIEIQKINRCCGRPSAPQPKPVQHDSQVEQSAEEVASLTPEDELALQEIPTRILLAECCLALVDVAEQHSDEEAIGRVEEIMAMVEMMPCMPE